MTAIYTPKGAAREYGELALNLYRGCVNGCAYCYAPASIRMTRHDFIKSRPRSRIIDKLKKVIPEYKGREVFLSFTSDPYQPIEAEHHLTRQAIELLADGGVKVKLLTKKPSLALDLDDELLRKADVFFGVSLSWTPSMTSDIWKHWESGADSPYSRYLSIRRAKDLGLRTWVSVEPVIIPGEALDAIRFCRPYVDHWAVGKLNHHPEIERGIDWHSFAREARGLLEGCDAYFKHDLRKAIGECDGKRSPKGPFS